MYIGSRIDIINDNNYNSLTHTICIYFIYYLSLLGIYM